MGRIRETEASGPRPWVYTKVVNTLNLARPTSWGVDTVIDISLVTALFMFELCKTRRDAGL